MGAFTSERTTTTSPPTTTTTRSTTTTKRITTTRRKTHKPLMVSRTKPMVAPANIPMSTKAARNPPSDWKANHNAEIASNQKLTKMHIQAGNASSLTLEVNNTIHIDTSSMVQILSVVVVIIAFIVFGAMICKGVRLSKFDRDINKIPTDVKMLKTKVDTLHNAFVSQADVNTISEGLHGYVNQENEIEIKKGVMNSAFSFVESSYEKSPEKITTTVQRF